jgi:hypothetical protein
MARLINSERVSPRRSWIAIRRWNCWSLINRFMRFMSKVYTYHTYNIKG